MMEKSYDEFNAGLNIEFKSEHNLDESDNDFQNMSDEVDTQGLNLKIQLM